MGSPLEGGGGASLAPENNSKHAVRLMKTTPAAIRGETAVEENGTVHFLADSAE